MTSFPKSPPLPWSVWPQVRMWGIQSLRSPASKAPGILVYSCKNIISKIILSAFAIIKRFTCTGDQYPHLPPTPAISDIPTWVLSIVDDSIPFTTRSLRERFDRRNCSNSVAFLRKQFSGAGSKTKKVALDTNFHNNYRYKFGNNFHCILMHTHTL